ncbi:hypothetical protein J6Y50_07175 [bacterium]|nr:hypothetical protein [bacterium]
MLREILVMVPTIVVTIMVGIMSARKRKRDINKVLSGKKYLREFECGISAAKNDSDVKSALLGLYNFPVYNVFLFNDHIAFTTGLVMGLGESIPDEIELKDINFAKMKNIFQTDLLVVNYNVKPKDESRSNEAFQFYMEGKKEDLLYIKNFIEERMHRPQIIDLTGRDQTEQ